MPGKKKAKNEVVEEEVSIMKRSQPSVEIKQDSKGNVTFSVKVYDDSPSEAKKEASKVFKELSKEF